ncbi:quinone oxidoreductase [Alteromonas australica]|uniref:zinc-dependent alcohol dehydrogenase family protein n=1 Tax=Alteromonas TaxID=226 RepID=UPI0005C42C30|nr:MULTISPECIES: zinc-dependent alcohol dehydrogenase family protein [Alteromonas]AJP43468.1 quinone oxidoreductase [Alteromonas australica]QPL48742.1 zinc-dependent alcohol dehydrogenase family protein [Alteromonas sp. B31-7]HBF70896.1 quinone oxidoreductase [Alteromonas australica]|tara:strand:- start:5796 stop:6785 length:990 start_codon:yes stop_codon:yes gene_type:complete
MKATVIEDFGGTDVFTSAELEKPNVKPGHVVVKVAATSVNTIDMMIRQMGTDLPFAPALPGVLGMDFAGVIDQVGEGVTRFKVGDEVYGCAGGLGDLQGAMAEYMLADAQLIAHKPTSLSMREAAAIPLVGITAYEGLTRAQASEGQSVLVHGGAGGVGHLAIQIARSFGANVYATGGSEAQAALIEKLGATYIDYRNEEVSDYVQAHTQGKGFDVVYDTVGGPNLQNSFAAAKLNGQVSTTVSLLETDLSPVHFSGLSLHVVFMLIPMIHNHNRSAHGEILTTLAQMADAGKLAPVLDNQAFSLSEASQAHDRLASGQVMGKIVISVP